MSGSSLDGIDLAYVKFTVNEEKIDYELLEAASVPFDERWMSRLQHLPNQNAETFVKTHVYFGHYLGEILNDFIKEFDLEPDFIASHGHTIFHDPQRRFTSQIGDGGAMAAITGQTVICDFRTLDIAIDGEGAPIAPAADRYLFNDYDLFMNLGGISNITCDANGKYVAFDISGANQILNVLANTIDLEFDKDGELASQGTVFQPILNTLSQNDYFKQPYPKSLANVWVREQIIPIFLSADCSLEDKLRTAVEHIALEIAVSLQDIFKKENFQKENYRLIATGGGAFNSFLIKIIQEKIQSLNVTIEIPSPEIIEYKEAILMGLMGVLRLEERVNCFSSVTGAKRNTIGGAVYLGK